MFSYSSKFCSGNVHNFSSFTKFAYFSSTITTLGLQSSSINFILSSGYSLSTGTYKAPIFNIAIIEIYKSILLSAKITTLSCASTPWDFKCLANLFAFSLNSLYVNLSFSKTIAILSGFSSACFSNTWAIVLSLGYSVFVSLKSYNNFCFSDSVTISISFKAISFDNTCSIIYKILLWISFTSFSVNLLVW